MWEVKKRCQDHQISYPKVIVEKCSSPLQRCNVRLYSCFPPDLVNSLLKLVRDVGSLLLLLVFFPLRRWASWSSRTSSGMTSSLSRARWPYSRAPTSIHSLPIGLGKHRRWSCTLCLQPSLPSRLMWFYCHSTHWLYCPSYSTTPSRSLLLLMIMMQYMPLTGILRVGCL